jgi:hypothetical protein
MNRIISDFLDFQAMEEGQTEIATAKAGFE